MLKYTVIGLSFFCLFNIAAHAGPAVNHTKNYKEKIGLGLGAIIGGIIAGPPGAILGAGGGAWYGDKERSKDEKLSALKKRLIEKQAEFAYLQKEFSTMQANHGSEMQKVKNQKRLSSLESLRQGISLTVYFSTGSAEIDQQVRPQIERLANFLHEFPELKLQLDAHTDIRGKDEYNKQLSKTRAEAVKRELIEAGLDIDRIRVYSHGESQARHRNGDLERYIFDRRVTIHLSLDTQA